MADDIASLGIVIDGTDVKSANDLLKQLEGQSVRTERGTKRMERGFDAMNREIRNSLAPLRQMQQLLLTLGLGFGVREVIRYADAWKGARNQLAAILGDQRRVNSVMNDLVGISTRTRTALQENVNLYARLAIVQKDLGATSAQLSQFTETVGKSLIISGANAQESAGAIRQLSQAMAAQVIQAQEFNSLNDAAPRLLRAVAESIDEAGGSIGRLRQLVLDQQITNREFFDALLQQSAVIDREYGNVQTTVSQAFTNLRTAVTVYIGQADSAIDATGTLAAGIEALADNLDILTAAIAGVAAAGLVAILARARTAVLALNVALAAMAANPVVAIAVAVGTVVTALIAAQDEIVQFGDRSVRVGNIISGIWQVISGAIEGAVGWMTHFMAALVQLSQGRFQDAWDSLRNAAGSVESIGTAFQEGVATMTEIYVPAIEVTVRKHGEELIPVIQDTVEVLDLSLDPALRKVRGNLLTYDDALALINSTIDEGLTDQQQYERQVDAVDQAMRLLAANGLSLTKEELEAINRALRQADPAWQEMTDAAQQAADEQAKIWENTANGLRQSFVTAFEDIFREGTSFLSSLANVGRRLFAELATNIVFGDFIRGVSSIGTGGTSSTANSVSTGSDLLSIFSFLPNLQNGIANLGAELATGVSGLLGPGAGGVVADLAGEIAQLADLTSIAAVAAGNFAASLINTPRRGPGNEIGATIGAIAGRFIPVIGQIPFVGEFIGSTLGALVGGLFGPQASRELEGFEGDLLSDAQVFFDEDPDNGRQATGDASEGIFNLFRQFAQGITAATGGTITGLDSDARGFDNHFSVETFLDRRTREPIYRVGFGGEVSGSGTEFRSAEEAIAFGFDRILNSLTGLDEEITAALDRIEFDPNDLQAGFDQLSILQSFLDLENSINDVSESLTPAQQAMQQLDTIINEWRGSLIELGIEAERIDAVIDTQMSQLRQGIEEQFTSLLFDRSGRGYLNQLFGAVSERGGLLSDAEAFGIDVGIVEEIYAATIGTIIDGLDANQLQDVIDNFQGFPVILQMANDALAALGETVGEVTDVVDEAAESEARIREMLEERYQLEIAGVQQTIAALTGRVNSVTAANSAVSNGIFRLNTDARFTPNAFERRQFASNTFDTLLEAALGGDVDAAQQLPEAAFALLDASRELYASGELFFQDRDRVADGLLRVEAVTLTELDILQEQLAVQRSMLASLEQAREDNAAAAQQDVETRTATSREDITQAGHAFGAAYRNSGMSAADFIASDLNQNVYIPLRDDLLSNIVDPEIIHEQLAAADILEQGEWAALAAGQRAVLNARGRELGLPGFNQGGTTGMAFRAHPNEIVFLGNQAQVVSAQQAQTQIRAGSFDTERLDRTFQSVGQAMVSTMEDLIEAVNEQTATSRKLDKRFQTLTAELTRK